MMRDQQFFCLNKKNCDKNVVKNKKIKNFSYKRKY